MTEVKESLAKQVSEREIESEDLRSQLLSTQATLTSAQKEIEGHRKREQQEELQIAENKMMMHQVLFKKMSFFTAQSPFCYVLSYFQKFQTPKRNF